MTDLTDLLAAYATGSVVAFGLAFLGAVYIGDPRKPAPDISKDSLLVHVGGCLGVVIWFAVTRLL